MTISDYLREDRILLDLAATTKEDAIAELADVLKDADEINDLGKYLDHVREREHLQTTGIGHGIALPHARSDAVDELFLVFGRSQQGIEFEAIDGQPVHLVFLVGTPTESLGTYLKLLAHLSLLLHPASFREELMKATSAEHVQRLLAKPLV